MSLEYNTEPIAALPLIKRGSQKETSDQLLAVSHEGTIITLARYEDREPAAEKPVTQRRRAYKRKPKSNGADMEKAEAGTTGVE